MFRSNDRRIRIPSGLQRLPKVIQPWNTAARLGASPYSKVENLFVRLLKWLCTRDRDFWAWHGFLSNALDFGEKVMNLTNDKQDLFCATKECLEVVEMPLCFWMFSRLTHDTDKRNSLYYSFETFLYPFISSRAKEYAAGSLPALLIVKVLFTNCSSRTDRTDDLSANLNEAIIECGKEDPWKLAWASLVEPQAYAERMARVRSREEIFGKEIRMHLEEKPYIRSREKTD